MNGARNAVRRGKRRRLRMALFVATSAAALASLLNGRRRMATWMPNRFDWGSTADLQQFWGRQGDDDAGFPSFEAQKRESMEYVRSIRNFQRTLLFVHVPKTAGSTLVSAAAAAGVSWGICMMRDSPECPTQASTDAMRRRPNIVLDAGFWHIPPHFWPFSVIVPSGYEPSTGTLRWWDDDPYKAADLFALVRDPIERQISDFNYFCRVVEGKSRSACNSASAMNAFFRHRLATKPSATEDYFRDGYHWIPAYDYVMRPNEVRQIDFVVPMDRNLPRNFDALASAFDAPFRFPRREKENEGKYDLTTADLQPDILNQLRVRFRRDYELLPPSHR